MPKIIIKIINDNKKKRSLEANFIFLKFQEVKLEAEHFNFLKIGLLKLQLIPCHNTMAFHFFEYQIGDDFGFWDSHC